MEKAVLVLLQDVETTSDLDNLDCNNLLEELLSSWSAGFILTIKQYTTHFVNQEIQSMKFNLVRRPSILEDGDSSSALEICKPGERVYTYLTHWNILLVTNYGHRYYKFDSLN